MKDFQHLCDEYARYLVKFTLSGKTMYVVSVSNREDNTSEYVLTSSGRIAASDDASCLLYMLTQPNEFRTPGKLETIAWATEGLMLEIETEDVYNLDVLLTTIKNKGLTKDSIETIVSVIKLMYDYRWQVNDMELDRLLDMPSIKKVESLYSAYVFWENVPKEKPFIQELSSIDQHQFVADFTKLLAAFFKLVEVLRC